MKKLSILSLALLITILAQARDWANFGRYAQANEQVCTSEAPAVVFIGNSITDFWKRDRPEFFDNNNYAGRGISGQTSVQMLARFQADVVNLNPQAVVISAGTNDLAQNQGYISNEHIVEVVKSMCQLARTNGIEPLIASVLPCHSFYWIKGITDCESKITALNDALRSYAAENNIVYVDYHTALDDGTGGLSTLHSTDGVHPTVEAYKVMESVVTPLLARFGRAEK